MNIINFVFSAYVQKCKWFGLFMFNYGTEIFATLGYWLRVRVIAGLFAVYVQLMNISIIDMHISLLFYCHNLAPKSIGNNIAYRYLRLVLVMQYCLKWVLVLVLPILF